MTRKEEGKDKKTTRSQLIPRYNQLLARTQVRTIPTEQWESRLLVWLLQYSMQRLEDLVHGLGKDASTSIIQSVVQDLTKRGLIDSVRPSLGVAEKDAWYYLTNKGVYAAAQQEGGDAVKLARAWGSDERSLLTLLPRFPGLATLQNIVNDLATLAPTDFSHLNTRPVEEGTETQIKWRWVRDYETEFHTKQRKTVRCEADAAVVIRRKAGKLLRDRFPQEEVYTLFVFMELGAVGFTDYSTMYQKIRSLLLYRESEEWRPYHRMFPLVMVLVGSARQKTLWQLAAHEAAKNLHLGMPLPAIIVDMAAEQRFTDERYAARPADQEAFGRDEYDKVWAYGWRHLMTDEPCSLQEMFLPVVEEAIPPGIMPDRVDMGTIEHKKRQTLVRGCYKERLENLLHKPVKPTKEKEFVALLGLLVSPRYRDILLIVYANPLMTIDELALLLDLKCITAKRYIYTLRSWGCVQSIELERRQAETHQEKKDSHREAKKELRWMLSERGLHHLAASHNVSAARVLKTQWATEASRKAEGGKMGNTESAISQEAAIDAGELAALSLSVSDSSPKKKREKKRSLGKWQPGVYILQKNLHHTAGVYHLVTAFHKAAAEQPGLSIAWFETGIRCSRRYQTRGPDKKERWHNFRPDVALELEYCVQDDAKRAVHRFLVWLEWDGGTMSSPNLKEKMVTYVHYLRSRGWRRERTGVIPMLVIVVPDRSQFDRMTRVAQEELADIDLLVCITMQDLLNAHGILGEIWSLAVPLPLERRTKLCALLEIMKEGGA